MGTEIKVWQLTDGQLREIQDDDLAASHHERDLEDWITKDPSILGTKLLVIGRQYETETGGRLDLLCIDETAALVIIEFKRDLSTRDAVAQILDYASWLDSVEPQEVYDCAEDYLKKPLAVAFQEYFGNPLQSITPQNHGMLLVAPKLDSAAERIINYLAERYKININAVFFRYAKTVQGDEILVRTVLVPDTVRSATSRRPSVTLSDLLNMAGERGIIKLLDICRSLRTVAGEEPVGTYGGSFRYWLGGRMICGINVSGTRVANKPANGEMDAWLPVPRLSEVVRIPEEEIRSEVGRKFDVVQANNWDCVVRLRTEDQASTLVATLKRWIASSEVPAS